MSEENVTRGYGLFEKFFSLQRMKKADKLIKKYGKDGTILDIGCGYYPYFLMNSNCSEKYGIDQGIKSCEFPKYNLRLINHNICDNLKLPFPKNSFDIITMLAVIEHFDNNQIIGIIKECYSLLKENGVLIITTPASWSDFLLKIMARVHLASPEEIGEHQYAYNLKELNEILVKSNFRQRNIKKGYFELFFNLWICGKKE